MAIEWREHHERLQATIKERAKGVGELLQSLCPADRVPLNSKTGKCPVCRRTPTTPKVPDEPISGRWNTAGLPRFKPTDDTTPKTKEDATPEPSPKATWPDGSPRVVGVAQETAQRQFWADHNRRMLEREQEAASGQARSRDGIARWSSDVTPEKTRADLIRENPEKYLRF